VRDLMRAALMDPVGPAGESCEIGRDDCHGASPPVRGLELREGDMGLSPGITVLIVHSDPLVSAGLSAILSEGTDFLVTQATPADVAVADYDSGLRLIASKQLHRNRVLILTQRDSEAAICHALEQGAGGYLLQGCSLAEIMSGIRLVCRGSIPLAPLAASKLAERLTQQSPLTPREVDILRQMMRGLSNKSIALKLDLAVGTVKTHVKSIFSKLHAGSRTQAVTVAQRRGILLEDEEGTSSRSSLSWSQGFQRPPRASSTQTCIGSGDRRFSGGGRRLDVGYVENTGPAKSHQGVRQ
jgi:DNA-binding NarL/FixJ family response regulator